MDFYNGGAFAECFYAQYPNGMGLEPPSALLARRLPAGKGPSSSPAPAPTARTQHALAEAAAAHHQRARATTHDEAFYAGRPRRDRAPTAVEPKGETKWEEGGGGGETGGGGLVAQPIVRSPPKAARPNAYERHLPPSLRLDGGGSVGGGGGEKGGRAIAVPFCVSSGQNRKKLIIPIEQRLGQQQQQQSEAVGESVLQLAKSLPRAVKEVAAELQARAETRAAAAERAQAAIEAEEVKRAKRLLDEQAAKIAATATPQQRRRETREERLERLRLERELREKEQQQKRRQRQLETAAARLHISVEDLEADEKLLRSIEEKASHLAAVEAPSLETYPSRGGTGGRQEDDEDGPAERKRVVMFARPVISNEGIAREMKELEKLQQESREQPTYSHASSGICLPEEKEEDDEDTESYTGKQSLRSKGTRSLRHDDVEDEDVDASFGINGLMRGRQRRL